MEPIWSRTQPLAPPRPLKVIDRLVWCGLLIALVLFLTAWMKSGRVLIWNGPPSGLPYQELLRDMENVLMRPKALFSDAGVGAMLVTLLACLLGLGFRCGHRFRLSNYPRMSKDALFVFGAWCQFLALLPLLGHGVPPWALWQVALFFGLCACGLLFGLGTRLAAWFNSGPEQAVS